LIFFDWFGIDHEFLKSDPLTWPKKDEFQKGFKIVQGLKIVNDIAERAVKLVKDYINILSQNENQKQYLLQILTEYRDQYSDSNKGTLMKEFH